MTSVRTITSAPATCAGYAPPLSGGFDVYDFFGEVYVPILEDAPFADILALEGAYRISDYSTSGQTETYKIGGEWAPVEDVRFRVLYNLLFARRTSRSCSLPSLTASARAILAPQRRILKALALPLCTATGVPNVGTYEQRISDRRSVWW